MAQALAVYAVAALLLVAGSGPALQAVRTSSLGEFEDLGEWRTLDEFPFLDKVHPYLPPLVVDWIIIQRDGPSDLPAGLEYRFDDAGRVVIVWPDGCEETEERYEEGSTCDPEAPDCGRDPSHPDCPDPCADPEHRDPRCLPPECPPGQVPDPDWPESEAACIPDPTCDADENGSHPAHCPRPDPPDTACSSGHIAAYDGSCIRIATTLLARVDDLGGAETDSRLVSFELKVPYDNLSLDIDWNGGLTNPGWKITVWDTTTGDHVCFTRTDAPDDDGNDCNPERTRDRQVAREGTAFYRDTMDGPLQPQNLTLQVAYTGPSTGGGDLEVRLYGKPRDGDGSVTHDG